MTGSGKNFPPISLTLMLGLGFTMLSLAGCSKMQDRFTPAKNERPVSQEQGLAQNSPLPGSAKNQKSGNMAGAKGLMNNRRLFEKPVSDPIVRIRRIEKALQDLRNDFDTAIPAMAGLIVSESELTQVLRDLKRSGTLSYTDITPPESDSLPRNPLEPKRRISKQASDTNSLNPDERQTSPGAVAPPRQMTDTFLKAREDTARKKAQEAADKARKVKKDKQEADKKAERARQKAQKQDPSYSTPQVLAVRVGSYPDKSRIVLDLSAPSSYSVDLDNKEKLLIIEVKDAGWKAKTSYNFSSSKLMGSFTAQDEGTNKSRLMIELNQPVEILKKFSLKAAGAKKDRIVVDIGSKN